MKKILLFILAILCAGSVMAAGKSFDNSCVYSSSYSQRSESGYIDCDYFYGVVVGSVSDTGGTLALYDSTWTTTGKFGFVSLSDEGVYTFLKHMANGLYYVFTGNVSGATMLYRGEW